MVSNSNLIPEILRAKPATPIALLALTPSELTSSIKLVDDSMRLNVNKRNNWFNAATATEGDAQPAAAGAMTELGAEPHLNTCFKHYMYFVYEFNLIPKKEELAPLQVVTRPNVARASPAGRPRAAHGSQGVPELGCRARDPRMRRRPRRNPRRAHRPTAGVD